MRISDCRLTATSSTLPPLIWSNLCRFLLNPNLAQVDTILVNSQAHHSIFFLIVCACRCSLTADRAQAGKVFALRLYVSSSTLWYALTGTVRKQQQQQTWHKSTRLWPVRDSTFYPRPDNRLLQVQCEGINPSSRVDCGSSQMCLLAWKSVKSRPALVGRSGLHPTAALPSFARFQSSQSQHSRANFLPKPRDLGRARSKRLCSRAVLRSRRQAFTATS